MANTTLHSAVGVKIGTLFPNPVGLLLAFLSHFPLDFFPEAYDKLKLWYKIAEGALLSVSLAYVFLFGINPWWLVACALAANIPDIIDYFTKKNVFFCHPKPRYTSLGFEFQTWGMPQWLNIIIDCILVILLLG